MTFLHCLLAAVLALTPGQPAAASAVLHEWDDRRAAAWSAGDPSAVRALYLPGSAAGRADAEMLRAWHERGLRVEGMRMQVLGLDVRRASDTRLVLVVTDRLTGAVAVGPAVRLPLPRDRPTSRRVVLVENEGVWRVALVTMVSRHEYPVRRKAR